jgi:general secretion pathway protein M
VRISERLSRLEPRERRLLGILAGVFGAMAFLAVPIGIAASVHARANENEALHEAINSIDEARERVAKAHAAREAVTARYASPSPPLAAFLAQIASEVQIEIPESQDRQAVPHGKRYTERSTKIVLRKAGMLKLIRLMEKIEASGHPMTMSALNIRKRGGEPDSFDVDMVVSAFDRKAPEVKKTDAKPADSAGEGEGEEKEPAP